MDELKKRRSSKAGTVTRRIRELNNVVSMKADKLEVNDRINNLKYALDELGIIQDEYMNLNASENPQIISEADKWYYEYDMRASKAIREAREYNYARERESEDHRFKLQKLEIPKFKSDMKTFFKWRSIFERLTRKCSDETKYDYLLNSTEGESRRYVENRNTYDDAMEKLNEKYGNVHTIIGLLIDEIKKLNMVKRGDFVSFENLSIKVNEFHEKLILMGKEHDAENSYVLKEIERKFNEDDYQRWLESCGDEIDQRTVRDLVSWLDKQTHIRRITHANCQPTVSNTSPDKGQQKFKSRFQINSSNIDQEERKLMVENKCILCSDEHLIKDCPKFSLLSLKDRWERAKSSRLCFLCLKGNHRRNECNEGNCKVCDGLHHQLLHNYTKQSHSETERHSDNYMGNSSSLINERKIERGFLPATDVTLNHKGRDIISTAILDTGSEINIITPRCCKKLNVKGEPAVMNIVGVGGIISTINTEIVEVSVKDRHGSTTLLECVVLEKACGEILPIDLNKFNDQDKYLLNQKKVYTRGGEVDILIGMSHPELHEQLSFIKLKSGLTLLETKLGNCLVGCHHNNTIKNYVRGNCNFSCGFVSMLAQKNDINLMEHLEAELAGIKEPPKDRCVDEIQFKNKIEIRRDDQCEGRFRVKLPWKVDPNTLENNKEQALERDKKLVKQLVNRGMVELFDTQIKDMIETGVIRKVNETYPRRYLPLLAVVNMNRDTTKVRVCLDARTKFKGTSFNDTLWKGKLEMTDIMKMLTHFRCGKFAILGDIRRMFWQILLDKDDEQYHGIVYKQETYVFTRISFGGSPSPNIADNCMASISQEGKDRYPLGAKVIEDKRYVDDILDASSDLEKIFEKRDETSKLLGEFGFDIKEWFSNHSAVGKVENSGKVLGIRWNGEEDTLGIYVKEKEKSKAFTRRMVLSRIAEIWDPLGIICGVTMIGKLILQSIVRMKMDWDVVVPDRELEAEWENWLQQLQKCEKVIVTRSILPVKKFESTPKCELVGFSDGSSVAHGCTLYIRWYNEQESVIDVRFVAAKGKVNPIKGTTVPRSEMCGAFLLSRLTHSAQEALKKTELNEKCDTENLFTDSSTVLSWIRSGAIKYKPYIKNKLIEIQELHPIHIWKYVPGKENSTADLISKGCNFEELDKITRGPEMLLRKRETWTKFSFTPKEAEINLEKNAKATTVNVAIKDNEPIFDVENFNSWEKIIRITAYVMKFVSMLKKTKMNSNETMLSVEVIERARKFWVVEAQKSLNDNTMKCIEKLLPYKDEEGIVKINGRLANMELFDEDRKRPIVLPNNHKISYLIVKGAHEKCIHAGYMRVVAEVRKKFWIVGVRKIARDISNKCIVCRRWRNSPLQQKMADLPALRLCVGIPFENTAVDYFGPFETKYGGRGKKKSYGAIFTCLTMRAVLVELVSDFTTDKFLLALRRFISIYGTPKLIVSDNGSNFVGAAREIKKILDSWRRQDTRNSRLLDFCDENLITWKFSTPLASHHNGAVESMVKCTKIALNKIVKGHLLSEEDYRTIFLEITACINSRPLWPASDGDVGGTPITCEDLIRPRGLPRDPIELNIAVNPRKRYQLIQNMVNEWWRLWMLHFTPNLQTRKKWFKIRENLEVGDIVLVVDTDAPRSHWKMGRVTKIYPGNDGLVRSARIKTSIGEYDRPITRLCILLSEAELNEN